MFLPRAETELATGINLSSGPKPKCSVSVGNSYMRSGSLKVFDEVSSCRSSMDERGGE